MKRILPLILAMALLLPVVARGDGFGMQYYTFLFDTELKYSWDKEMPESSATDDVMTYDFGGMKLYMGFSDGTLSYIIIDADEASEADMLYAAHLVMFSQTVSQNDVFKAYADYRKTGTGSAIYNDGWVLMIKKTEDGTVRCTLMNYKGL